jgi:hypothetical protein
MAEMRATGPMMRPCGLGWVHDPALERLLTPSTDLPGVRSPMRVRTMTVGDLRAALADKADWQPVTIEIEGDEGTSTTDLDGVVERSSFEGGEVTVVLSGRRHGGGPNERPRPPGPTRRAGHEEGTRDV